MGAEKFHTFIFKTTSMEFVTIDDLDPIKEKYEQAVKDDEKVFVYNNMELLTAYAKYLIEYLTTEREKAIKRKQ